MRPLRLASAIVVSAVHRTCLYAGEHWWKAMAATLASTQQRLQVAGLDYKALLQHLHPTAAEGCQAEAMLGRCNRWASCLLVARCRWQRNCAIRQR